MPIESVMPSSHLILCRPLLLLPPIPSSNRVFSNESALCMRWPKYWSFSFSISPSNEHPGLISFRMDSYFNLIPRPTSPGQPPMWPHHTLSLSAAPCCMHAAPSECITRHASSSCACLPCWLLRPSTSGGTIQLYTARTSRALSK